MRRLLPVVALFAVGSLAMYAQAIPQLDCGQPADVQVSPGAQANLRFQGSNGESVYVRVIAPAGDPSFVLSTAVVADPFGNTINPRPRNQSLAQAIAQPIAGATPVDLAGGLVGGETFLGLEFDLNTDGVFTLQLFSSSGNATVHVVLSRLNRPCGVNTTLTCGHSIGGAISSTVPGQVDNYQFSVTSGDVVSFRLLRVASSGSVNTNTGFFFAIYAADPTQNNQIGRASCRERV